MILWFLLACRPPADGESPPQDSPVPPASVQFTPLGWSLSEQFRSLATVRWRQDVPATVHVEYSFDEGIWLSSPSREAPAGTSEQILLGIPYDTEVRWDLVVDESDTIFGGRHTGGTLHTERGPTDLNQAVLLISDPERQYTEGRYLLTNVNSTPGGWVDGTFWSVILDRKGRPVWAVGGDDWTLFSQVAPSGDYLLWDNITYWSQWDYGYDSQIHRTFLDREIDVTPARGLHHAFVEMDDGTLIWGSQLHEDEEVLVELSPGDDTERVVWSCLTDIPGMLDFVTPDCKSNGLYFSPGRDTFLFSMYDNDSVIEIDHATWQTRWWAGGIQGGYAFVPEEAAFEFQHGPTWTEAGTLLVSSDDELTGHTLGREYAVDREARTITQVWSYDPGILAERNGDIRRLPNGNTLHLLGASGTINEVDPKGNVVWQVEYPEGRMLARGEFIGDLYALVGK